jgi:hypothetical protein
MGHKEGKKRIIFQNPTSHKTHIKRKKGTGNLKIIISLDKPSHLMNANCDKVFPLPEPPPLQLGHEIKQHVKPNLFK